MRRPTDILDRMFPKVDSVTRKWLPRSTVHVSDGPAPAVADAHHGGGRPEPGGGAPVAPADLLERRTALAQALAEAQWDLGGLAYEMAIRDHFRPDVLVRKAADLQRIDAELGEVERLVRMEDAGAAGTCSSCGALHGRGAVFCWQCGLQLMPTTSAAA